MGVMCMLDDGSALVDDGQWSLYQVCALPYITKLLCMYWLHHLWVLIEDLSWLVAHPGLSPVLLETMLTHAVFRILKGFFQLMRPN